MDKQKEKIREGGAEKLRREEVRGHSRLMLPSVL